MSLSIHSKSEVGRRSDLLSPLSSSPSSNTNHTKHTLHTLHTGTSTMARTPLLLAVAAVLLASPVMGFMRPATPSTSRRRAAMRMMAAGSSNKAGWALLFDCDGVLADTERDGHRPCFNIAFQQKGIDCTWDVGLYGKLLEVRPGYAPRHRVYVLCRERPDIRIGVCGISLLRSRLCNIVLSYHCTQSQDAVCS